MRGREEEKERRERGREERDRREKRGERKRREKRGEKREEENIITYTMIFPHVSIQPRFSAVKSIIASTFVSKRK